MGVVGPSARMSGSVMPASAGRPGPGEISTPAGRRAHRAAGQAAPACVRRRDLAAELQHPTHADEDYRMLPELGIAVAREGIPWPMVDRGNGEYDFSIIEPFLTFSRAW